MGTSSLRDYLRNAFPGINFDVEGTPKDLEGAQNLALRDKYQFQWWACSLVNAQPYGGKKKGADGGIDGTIYFQDDSGEAKKIIVSVKGGESINVGMIRDLKGVLERQRAEIGIFVTLVPPTGPMQVEATAAGFYTNPHGEKYPKIQILTIEELLHKTKRPEFRDLGDGSLTFKKAQREKKLSGQEGMF